MSTQIVLRVVNCSLRAIVCLLSWAKAGDYFKAIESFTNLRRLLDCFSLFGNIANLLLQLTSINELSEMGLCDILSSHNV